MSTLNLKVAFAMCALAAAFVPAIAQQTLSSGDRKAMVSESAKNSHVLRETMRKLSPADQVTFLAEVNDAISKMPASDEVKSATYYMANSAAIKSASKGNVANMLAEVYATVPPEYLTDINERFATDLFNRSGSNGETFSDAEFVAIVQNAMKVINERCDKAENSGVRQTFAALMFIRASGGTPANITDALVETMPDQKTRDMAKNEWIPAALGQDQAPTYDPMLGASQAGEEPNHDQVVVLTSGGDKTVSMLGALSGINKAEDITRPGIGFGNAAEGSLRTASDSTGNAGRMPAAWTTWDPSVVPGGNEKGPYSEDNKPPFENPFGEVGKYPEQ